MCVDLASYFHLFHVKFLVLTERRGDISDERSQSWSDEEPLRRRIQSNHVIRYGGEHERYGGEDRRFCQGLW